MWPYWVMFVLFAIVAMNKLQPVLPSTQSVDSILGRLLVLRQWGPVFALLTLMVGLRHEVGADWGNYLVHLELVPDLLADALIETDPAYALLNWVTAELGLGVHFVNTVCAALFAWGLVAFCRRQPLPWLALVVAIPYLVTVVAMGYTRQGVAIGLALLGLAALDHGRIFHFLLYMAFAAAFHRSAVVLLPLAALVGAQRRLWILVLIGTITSLLFWLLLEESIEGLRVNYIEAEFQSSGTGVRVAMNALPAVLFLVLRNRFQLEPGQHKFWTWMAVGGICFVGLFYISPSSTAVDRMALYWIPLQLFVLSRLPSAFGSPEQVNPVWTYVIVAYSALVLLVWLMYADNAFWWLPYQFYPWVLWR